MKKRYYYTDPLAAAWMGKYHKIDFISHIIDDDLPLGSKIQFRKSRLKDEFWRVESDKAANFFTILRQMKELTFCAHRTTKNSKRINKRLPKNKRGKLYIHLDCYNLFTPQAGDLCQLPTGYLVVDEDKVFADHLVRFLKIIQRQGKAFFMPEEEIAKQDKEI